MKSMASFLIIIVVASGCAAGPRASSPEQLAFLQSLSADAPEFDLAKDQADDAMGRAQVFITKYATMKIRTLTPNVIETFAVPEGNILTPQSYGYRVTRANVAGKAHFTVECFNGLEGAVFKSAHEAPEQNARLLARYMKTGVLEYPELVAR